MQKNSAVPRAIASGALLTGASSGIFSNSIGLFIGPVCADLGLPRGKFALIASTSLLFSMAALPLFGRLLKRAPLRLTAAVCAVVCSAAPLVYSFCGKLWQFYLTAAVNGLFVNGITLLTVGALLKRLSAEPRSSAAGAAFAGAGVFSFLSMPLLQRVTSLFGWRWGYRLQSAMGAAVLFGALLLMPPDRLAPPGQDRGEGHTFIYIFKLRSFLLPAAGLFLANAANLALYSHAAAALSDAGLTASSAALYVSLAALFSSAAKPLFGLVLDKLGLRAGALLLGSALIIGAASALMLEVSAAARLCFPALLGLCACANGIPANALASRLFAKEDFEAALCALTLSATAGSALGSPAAGAVFDLSGSYRVMWYACIAAGALSAAAIFFAAAKRHK